MKSWFFYTALILTIEYGLGYGLAKKILPKNLTQHAFIMGPWILNVFVILAMVTTSLVGISGKYTAFTIAVLLAILSFAERKKLKLTGTKLVMVGVVITSVIFNSSPLLLRDKFLTTISLGNNDVIAYATNADYLLERSIRDSFQEPVILTIANLLHDGYRWGTPLLQTFFLSLTQTSAWQITYLSQVILFATMVPLGYVLYSLWYDNKDKLGYLIPIIIAFNANLLYMLYHNFFGQVVFWGIELLLVIWLTEYFRTPSRKLEWLTGATLSAMYMAYHEPALFLLVPLVVTGIIQKNWQGILRIAGITALLAAIPTLNAIVFDFGQAFQGDPNQPIGWQVFRARLPMANPIEVMGISSVHTAQPLATGVAWGGSLLVIGLWIIGAGKSQVKVYTRSMIIFFALMFYWTSLGKNGNWFVFNRAFTYVLPLITIIFVGGFGWLKEKMIRWVLLSSLLGLVVWQGIRLNSRFINSHLSIHAWYQSLKEIKEQKIKEPIYTISMLSPYVSLWDQIWIGYFLYPMVDDITIPKETIGEGKLVLLNKSTPWVRYPSYRLKELEWENDFYKLGRLCLSDQCLSSESAGLNEIEFGKSEYEDNLLISGWSNPEKEGRWIEGQKGELKLWASEGTKKLVLEMQAFVPSTGVEIWLDGKLLEKIALEVDWQKYVVMQEVEAGFHQITIMSDKATSPAELDGGSDNRQLSIRLRSVSFTE